MEGRRKTKVQAQQPDDDKNHGLTRLTRGLKRLSEATSAAARGDTAWSSVLDVALEASTPAKRRTYAVSCLMDGKPKFQEQTLNLVAGLHMCDASEELAIFVHYTKPQPTALLSKLQGLGVNLVEVEPFGEGPAVYCNKLQQLPTFEGTEFDEVILCDTDMAFISSPTRFAGSGCVRAKVVDMPNPPEGVLVELLGRAGFKEASLTARPDFAVGESTHLFNCNGGFYILPGDIVPELGKLWVGWSRFCLQQGALLGKRLHHSDQLGFMLAILEGGFNFEALPLAANFPTHFDAVHYRGVRGAQIGALHYHDKVDDNGALLPTGVPKIDKAIALANKRIAKGRAVLGIDGGLSRAA